MLCKGSDQLKPKVAVFRPFCVINYRVLKCILEVLFYGCCTLIKH